MKEIGDLPKETLDFLLYPFLSGETDKYFIHLNIYHGLKGNDGTLVIWYYPNNKSFVIHSIEGNLTEWSEDSKPNYKEKPNRWVSSEYLRDDFSKNYFYKHSVRSVIKFIENIHIDEVYLSRGPDCEDNIDEVGENIYGRHPDYPQGDNPSLGSIQRLSHKIKIHSQKKIRDRIPNILSSKKELSDEIKSLPSSDKSTITEKKVKPKYFKDAKNKYRFDDTDDNDMESTSTEYSFPGGIDYIQAKQNWGK